MMARRFSILAVAMPLVASSAVPKGHLEPFGGWAEGSPVAERDDIPEPKEFYDQYNIGEDGFGLPLIMRGSASEMEAMSWTDEYMLKHYPKENIKGGVEHQLKETRAGGKVKGMNKMEDFLGAYNTRDIYMVSTLPPKMKKAFKFLPCVKCGGFLNYLDVPNFWMGRGGSSSVIHYDDQDNINCMIAGRKRFNFMHPRWKKKFEANPNTKKNKFGWVDADMSKKVKGYGAFMGNVNASAMDLVNYPGWLDVEWSYADLNPGDCLYIPYQWYHQVVAAPVRSINVHMWYWRPHQFDEESCSGAAADDMPTFADCSWGYEPNTGHLGKPKSKAKLTKCKKAKKQEL